MFFKRNSHEGDSGAPESTNSRKLGKALGALTLLTIGVGGGFIAAEALHEEHEESTRTELIDRGTELTIAGCEQIGKAEVEDAFPAPKPLTDAQAADSEVLRKRADAIEDRNSGAQQLFEQSVAECIDEHLIDRVAAQVGEYEMPNVIGNQEG